MCHYENHNLRGKHSLLLPEAHSRRSRSFIGKLTNVESLLVRTRASEKRFRSGQGRGIKESSSAQLVHTIVHIITIWIR